MARSKAEDIKKQIMPDISVRELWMRLDTAMKHSGMYAHIAATPELKFMLEKAEDGSRHKDNKDVFMYNTRVEVARHIIKGSPAWLARVVSNAKRVAPIVDIKEKFFKYGPSALPSHFKHAERFGGVFRWDGADAKTEIVMMVRGIGKTHIEVVIESLHGFIVAPHHKMLIGHSEEDKAKDNLKRIKDALFHPYLMVIFPEFFVDNPELYRNRGVEIGKSRINMRTTDFNDMWRMIDPSDYMRGEATWNLFTPLIDVTGQHYNRAILDDFVTDKNSIQYEQQQRIIDVFDGLTGLEEYEFDEDGNKLETGFPIKVVGTQKIIPNLYSDILDTGNRKIKSFIVPMSWDPDEHKTAYHYCKEHKHKIWDKLVTDAFIEQKKSEFKTEEKFLAECYMMGRERSSTVSIVDSDDQSFLFAYYDESAPEGVPRIKWKREDIAANSLVIHSKDPSYSSKNKSMESDCSKDTTGTACYFDGTHHIVDFRQSLGAMTVDLQVQPIKELADHWGVDAVIIDSHSTQIFISKAIIDRLRTKEFKDLVYVNYLEYTSAKDTDIKGKVARANEILGVAFLSKIFRIHWTLGPVIREIIRETKGFDFLDILIQIAGTPKPMYDSMLMSKQYLTPKKKHLTRESVSDILFETTGY